MDFPTTAVPPISLSTWSNFGPAESAYPMSPGAWGAPADLTWVASLAMYFPVRIPWRYTVKRVYWVGGAANASNTSDFGIYTMSGTKIYSTGLLTGANNATKYTTPTAFILDPGTYLFAYSSTGTTTNVFGTTAMTAEMARFSGVLQEDLSGAGTPGLLPATATFSTVTNALFPVIGVTSSLY